MNEITLTLTLQEVNGILQILGELPTKSNVFLLLKKIEQQATEQLPEKPQE